MRAGLKQAKARLLTRIWATMRQTRDSISSHFRVDHKNLSLDLIFPLEHLVDFCKIICFLGDGIGTAFGDVILLKVSFLSKSAHLHHNQHHKSSDTIKYTLTSSYVLGGTVRLASSRSWRFTVFAMVLMSPVTLILKKELARPLP